MRKRILCMILTVLFVMMSLPAYAAEKAHFDEPLANGAVRLVVNDQWVATGLLAEGRTFITLQAMSNIIDAAVEWEMETQKITIIPHNKKDADDTLVLYVGDDKFYKNGSVFALDVPPQFREGHLLIPATILKEALNGEMMWQESSRTVFITANQTAKPIAKVSTAAKPVTPPETATQPAQIVTQPAQTIATTPQPAAETVDGRTQGTLAAWEYGLRDGIFVEDMMSEDGYGMNFYIYDLNPQDTSRPSLDKQTFQLLVTDKYKERVVYTQTFVYGELPREIGQMVNLNVPSQYFNESQYSYEIVVKA